MKHPLMLASAFAIVSVLLAIWGLCPEQSAQAPRSAMVSLVLDTDIGVNSATMRKGAQLAVKEFQASLSTVALQGTVVPERQIQLIREQIDSGAKAVLLAPVDETVVDDAVRLCVDRGVWLVLLDVSESCRGKAPCVGTDHWDAGIKAAETIIRVSQSDQLLIFSSGDRISKERLTGVSVAAEQSGVKTVVCVNDSFDDASYAQWVRAMIERNQDAGAVLCLDGALTECAARELKAMAAHRVTLAGFDCDQTHISYLKDGRIRFTMLQEPLAVGYRGVECAIKLMNGETAPPIQSIETAVIMSEDALKSENVQLVFPLL